MTGHLNRVSLIGNVVADPESRSFQNGGKVCNLRIATTETWKAASGEKKEKTEYHSVAIFSEGLAGVAERYLRKGSKVFVEGKLQTRKWTDQSGNDRYSTEIVLQGYDAKMILLDGKRADSGQSGSGGQSRDQRSQNRDDDLEDSVPF